MHSLFLESLKVFAKRSQRLAQGSASKKLKLAMLWRMEVAEIQVVLIHACDADPQIGSVAGVAHWYRDSKLCNTTLL